jgi:hypothetical protein
MSKFRELRDQDVDTLEIENDNSIAEEPYIVGLDDSGEYVVKHRQTGQLLNSSDFHTENFSYYEGADYYTVNSGDDFSFFEKYEGNYVNGKREGTGKYSAIDIDAGQLSLDFEGTFVNNLPSQGKLKFNENGQFVTTIKGFFVNGLPDETKKCEVKYRVFNNGKKVEAHTMIGFVSFRDVNGMLPTFIRDNLNSNKPYNLIHAYFMHGFKVTGTKQTKIYQPSLPIEYGIFTSHGKNISKLGGMRSKKSLNHKRKHSRKN